VARARRLYSTKNARPTFFSKPGKQLPHRQKATQKNTKERQTIADYKWVAA
jgi:hypothetical protein